MLKIALISPKGPLYRHRGGIFKRGLRYKPLTLPTLAALIPDDLPHRLECFDEGIQDVPDDIEADIVGMTVITGTATRAYELAARLRQRGITVVLGGPHVTLVPDDAQGHADAIVVGYAEAEWPKLLRDFAAGRLKPRYRQGPDLDLAAAPLPKREVLPAKKYLTDQVFEATRSCKHRCSFCVAPSAWGGAAIQHPVEKVVADIKAQGARRAIFVDLNLIADRRYAKALFEALVPLRIQWFGLATTLLVHDSELLELCARSGCRGLLMGLESIHPESLAGIEKRFNDPGQYAAVVERLHRHGIALQGCFVFGHDHDDEQVFMDTARFAVEAGIDLPRYAILTPFPGTPLFRQLESQGRILHRHWEQYDGQHVVFQPQRLSPRALEAGLQTAWRHTYSMANCWRRLRRTAAPWHVALVTNLGYRYYARNLRRFYTCDVMSWDAPRGATVAA